MAFDANALFNALGVALTVVFFLIPIVVLFFKTVDDTIKSVEFLWLSLPFALSLGGVLLTQGSPLRFLFWLTGLGFWIGIPVCFLLAERRSNAAMLAEDLEKCRELIAYDPNNAAAYAKLGSLHARQKQWAEAVEAYARAVELEPENKKYRWDLGKARYELERLAAQEPSDAGTEPQERPEKEETESQTEEQTQSEVFATRTQKAIQTIRPSELECPRCPGPLHSVTWQEVALEGCGQCGGFWLKKDQLARLVKTGLGTFAELQSLFGRQWSATRVERERLICPLCQAELQRVALAQAPGLPLHGCPPCGGLWFEHGELGQLEERLQALQGGVSEEVNMVKGEQK